MQYWWCVCYCSLLRRCCKRCRLWQASSNSFVTNP